MLNASPPGTETRQAATAPPELSSSARRGDVDSSVGSALIGGVVGPDHEPPVRRLNVREFLPRLEITPPVFTAKCRTDPPSALRYLLTGQALQLRPSDLGGGFAGIRHNWTPFD